MVTVLKLGGSVITEKDRPETLDGPSLDTAAAAIATALAADPRDLVLVHGGGSFGHHHADAHGVSTTEGTGDGAAALGIHGAMKTLNQFVLGRLHEHGVAALPVHPLSVASRDADGVLSMPVGAVRALLDEAFVPVLHGDVVAHAGRGVTVLSGDELVVHLADELHARRVGLCSTVPGVLDDRGDVVETITSFDDVASVVGDSDTTDVSGGMAGKVRTLLGLSAPTHVFDLEGLPAFLSGESPGTRIEGAADQG